MRLTRGLISDQSETGENWEFWLNPCPSGVLFLAVFKTSKWINSHYFDAVRFQLLQNTQYMYKKSETRLKHSLNYKKREIICPGIQISLSIENPIGKGVLLYPTLFYLFVFFKECGVFYENLEDAMLTREKKTKNNNNINLTLHVPLPDKSNFTVKQYQSIQVLIMLTGLWEECA